MKEITVPAISANEDVIKLVKILIKKNEFCKKNKAICSVESSKTSIDFEVKSEGYIFIFANEGSDVKIGEVIGLLSDKKINNESVEKYLKKDKESKDIVITKKADQQVNKQITGQMSKHE